jgi:hypothetical protein
MPIDRPFRMVKQASAGYDQLSQAGEQDFT